MEPVTFLDKIELAFSEAKGWLIHEFGDHMSVHNALGDLKMKVLTGAAEHFGDETDSPANSPSDDSKAP